MFGQADKRTDKPHTWLQYHKSLGIDIIFLRGKAGEIRFNKGFIYLGVSSRRSSSAAELTRYLRANSENSTFISRRKSLLKELRCIPQIVAASCVETKRLLSKTNSKASLSLDVELSLFRSRLRDPCQLQTTLRSEDQYVPGRCCRSRFLSSL